MRISDWSSDVCSSDLSCQFPAQDADRATAALAPSLALMTRPDRVSLRGDQRHVLGRQAQPLRERAALLDQPVAKRDHFRLARRRRGGHREVAHRALQRAVEERSEEHTSALQSLMRISYAGFCLKKK